jgi:hypothetical protein
LQTGNSHMALLMAPSGSDIEELKRTRGRLFSRDVDSTTDPTVSTTTAADMAGQLFGVDSGALMPTPEEEEGRRSSEGHQPGSSSSMTRRQQKREKRVSWKNSFTSFTQRHSRSPSPVDEAEQQLQELGCKKEQQWQQHEEQQSDQTYIALDIIQPPAADVFGSCHSSTNGSSKAPQAGAAAVAPCPAGAAAAAAAHAFKSHQGSGAAAAKGGSGTSNGVLLPEVPVGIITLEDVMEELLQVRMVETAVCPVLR